MSGRPLQSAIDEATDDGASSRMLDIIGDSWSLQIITLAFCGVSRFEGWRLRMGISRAVLQNRLAHLVGAGVLTASGEGHRSYALSGMGLGLLNVVLALWRWEQKWLDGLSCDAVVVHKPCGEPLSLVYGCAHCEAEITYRNSAHSYDDHAGGRPAATTRNRRTASASRPAGRAPAADIVGDRWSFLVMGKIMQGVRRFDEIVGETGIATNILADRLAQLQAVGVVERRPAAERIDWFDYYPTPAGEDLFPIRLEMYFWGDAWLAGPGEGLAPCYHRPCGTVLTPQTRCGGCERPIAASDLRITLPSLLDLRDEGEAALNQG